MKLLAISGSARRDSTNTAMLMAMQAAAPQGLALTVVHRLDQWPLFSPDREGAHTPAAVLAFAAALAAADGVIIASPEYVRAIPAGLKNAIEWMVSRKEIIGKPIALAHASHRGDEMLASLRSVLSTVSDGFMASPFLRLPLLGQTPAQIAALLREAPHLAQLRQFLGEFAAAIAARQAAREPAHAFTLPPL